MPDVRRSKVNAAVLVVNKDGLNIGAGVEYDLDRQVAGRPLREYVREEWFEPRRTAPQTPTEE